MTIVDRFIKYVGFDTQSSTESDTFPSTSTQLIFAQYLGEELKSIGLEEVVLDENGYLFATLPANTTKELPTVGFIAHYDTSPDYCGANITPRIVENYDGKDIILCEGVVTSPKQFPELLQHIGEDILVTNGKTLLGADDKAGIVEIVEAMIYLMAHPEIEHGKIRVGFTPDEEVGMGASRFDVEKFGCDWAYTMDGSEVGEIEFENFNAASAKIEIEGLNVHPGYAKNKMLNANLMAAKFMALLPENETPETTTGYEGFYHLMSIKAEVEKATLIYIIRDHDRKLFESRKAFMTECVKQFNAQYNKQVATIELSDQYYNMREKVEPMMHIVEVAKEAITLAGAKPYVKAIRGGTDGSQLSFKGLPCPNIFAGGLNFHGRHEFLPIPSMEKAMMTIVHLCQQIATK